MPIPNLNEWPEPQLLLLQVDLSGHSKTLGGLNAREAAQERTKFATNLANDLKEFRFELCFWAGDGGLFYREYRTPTSSTADQSISAADRAITEFKRFLRSDSRLVGLSLRLTATLTQVVCHTSPGNWYGIEFNRFLKYERHLSKFGQFVITQNLREALSKELREDRFPTVFQFALPDQQNVIVSVDNKYPKPPEETSGQLLDQWLKKNERNLPLPSLRAKGNLPKHTVVGNAVVVDTARSKSGYSSIDFRRIDFPMKKFEELLHATEYWGLWEMKLRVNRDHAGTKASVLRLAHPTSDESRLLLTLAEVPYYIVRSFNDLIEENKEGIQGALVEMAFAFETGDGRKIPGTLATENAVIIEGNSAKDRYLLLAHRSGSQGSNRDTWSASFEEQFSPVEWTGGGRVHRADENVAETVLRGIREEFLGDDYSGAISIEQHAAYVQLDNFNIDILGIVRTPGCSFEDIKQLALANKPIDHMEHNALGVLPIEKEALRQAINSQGPAGLFAEFLGPEGTVLASQIKDHPWHPTSRARMACCLWLLEEGLL